MEIVETNMVEVGDRARKDMGDVDSMVASIKEFGIIQPILLNKTVADQTPRLVVGGRRLEALKKLGITILRHGIEYVWRYETDDLRLKSMELEENLKRKDMSWDEIVTAKAKLLEIMQKIHGPSNAVGGGMTRSEKATGVTEGFGTRKLSAMLGESLGTTSQDLQLANMIKVMPNLKHCENKSSALRTGMLQLVVGVIRKKETDAKIEQALNPTVEVPKEWMLYEGDFRANIPQIPNSSVDLVFTDLPYGVDLQKNDMQGINFTDSRSTIIGLLPTIARESYRILRPERYAVYWFGYNFYTELKTALESAGFQVNPIPAIWIKHRNYSPNPLRWFTSGYEQALVACKGDAKLVRPGANDIIDLPNVTVSQKINVAQKPVELCEKFILDMTLPSATVADLFAGSGSTGVAAVKNGRKVILFELDKTQCLLIRNRMDALKS